MLRKLSICLLLVPMLLGCGPRRYPATLRMVDSFCSACPDSAISLLARYADSLSGAPQAVRMYHHLLQIKARDKAYVRHTSDSAILSVLHYYINGGDRHLLPEAYYYAGRVYSDLGDAPQALDCFEKALESMKGGYEDLELKGVAYSQMGRLFSYQGLYRESLEMNKKGYANSMRLKDNNGMAYALNDIGFAYLCMDMPDSALFYFKKACSVSRLLNDTIFSAMMLSQQASLFLNIGRYDSAAIYIRPALLYTEKNSRSGIYSIAAELFYKMGAVDSALFYYDKLMSCGDVYAHEAAHRGMADIALRRGNLKEAAKQFELYEICSDSIDKLTQTETVARMQSLYNYRLREKENERLRRQNRTKQKWVWIWSCCAVLAVLAGLGYRAYSKQKSQTLLFWLDYMSHLKNEIVEQSKQYADATKKRMEELSNKQEELRDINIQLQAELEREKDKLYHAKSLAELRLSELEKGKEAIKKTSVYKYLQAKNTSPVGDTVLTETEWKEVQALVDRFYPDFFKKLSDVYAFNPNDLRLCMLIKLNFPPMDMARLTGRKKETVSSARRRLFEKIFQKKCRSISDFDEFIRSL